MDNTNDIIPKIWDGAHPTTWGIQPEEGETMFFYIPEFPKYVISNQARVFRIYGKGSKRYLRVLKTRTVSESRKDRAHPRIANRVQLIHESGAKKYIYPVPTARRTLLAAGVDWDEDWLANLPHPTEYIQLPDVWMLYFINRHGDVWQLVDLNGVTAYKRIRYYVDAAPSRNTPIERVNIRSYSYMPRTYTRTALVRMYKEKMEWREDFSDFLEPDTSTA